MKKTIQALIIVSVIISVVGGLYYSNSAKSRNRICDPEVTNYEDEIPFMTKGVSIGMTEDEVITVMGKPYLRRGITGSVDLIYESDDFYKRVVMKISEGMVVGEEVTFFVDTGPGSEFKPIKK